MRNLGEPNETRAGRPYWLLLALVLFFAGQIAVASHWHDDANALDADCALCILSSASGAALNSETLTISGFALCVVVFRYIARAFVARRTQAYASRAPPVHS